VRERSGTPHACMHISPAPCVASHLRGMLTQLTCLQTRRWRPYDQAACAAAKVSMRHTAGYSWHPPTCMRHSFALKPHGIRIHALGGALDQRHKRAAGRHSCCREVSFHACSTMASFLLQGSVIPATRGPIQAPPRSTQRHLSVTQRHPHSATRCHAAAQMHAVAQAAPRTVTQPC
jgi:hypothetical protein